MDLPFVRHFIDTPPELLHILIINYKRKFLVYVLRFVTWRFKQVNVVCLKVTVLANAN